ncbi:MAG TPA: hypothetical protein VM144_10920 [Aestuariivirga sp.]|nr:hypothetical protein [Aestuariivirga sp.]
MTERNLILIHRGLEYERDFDEIADKVFALDGSITIYSLGSRYTVQLPDSAWKKPTLVVALTSRYNLKVKRGTVLTNHVIDKIAQGTIVSAAGINTPPVLPFTFGMKLDPILFGEFVIIKPRDFGLTSTGKGIQLFRRRRLETVRPEDFPADHPIFRARTGYLVQRFIDTGKFPTYSRVLTFLGQPIYSANGALTTPRPDLTCSDAVLEAASISIQGGARQRQWGVDEDVLDMARKVGAAFSNVPLLAIDIIREQASQKIYFLECNPGGNTWHFSSLQPGGIKIRMLLGESDKYGKKMALKLGRQRMIVQTGAFDVIAKVLVERTHELAT